MLIAADFTCEAYEVLVAAELVIVIILIITIRISTKLKGFRFLFTCTRPYKGWCCVGWYRG